MIRWYRNIKVKPLEKVMYNFILLSKALSLSLSRFSGLENSLTHFNFNKLNLALNYNSHSGDILLWSKQNDKKF